MSLSVLDAVAGISVLSYGLLALALGLRRGDVPVAAVLASLPAGFALASSASPSSIAAPILVASIEAASAICVGVGVAPGGGIASYLRRHRRSMPLADGLASAAEDRGCRIAFCVAASAVAAAEICRCAAAVSAARGRTGAGGGGARSGGGGEEEEEEGGWARRNAREWEEWRDSCDPLLRDVSGGYDPDAVRRMRGTGTGRRGPGGGGGGLEEPLLGGPSSSTTEGGGEETFERRHGRGRRGAEERGGRTSGEMFSVLRWGRGGSSTAAGAGDEESQSVSGSSAGFAPVDSDIDDGSFWPPQPGA